MTPWCPQLLLSKYSAPSDVSAVSEQQRLKHPTLIMKQLLGNTLSHLMLEKKQTLQCGPPCAATHHAGGCGDAVAWGACAARLKAGSLQRNRDRTARHVCSGKCHMGSCSSVRRWRKLRRKGQYDKHESSSCHKNDPCRQGSDSFKQDGQSYAAEISCAASPKGPGISWSQTAASSDLPLYRGLLSQFLLLGQPMASL